MECKSIVVLSDTHDNTEIVQKALLQIQTLDFVKVLHCGDVTTPETLRLFEGLPLEIVFGNCDYDTASLQDTAKELGLAPFDYTKELNIAGKRIAFMHGDNQSTLSHIIYSGSFDYVFHGHIHQKKDILVENTRVICPGALQRAVPYSFAYFNLETDTLEYHEVEP